MLFPLYDRNPHQRFPWVTLLLIVANVWVTFQVSQLSPRQQTELVLKHGFIPQRLTSLDAQQPLLIRQPVPDRLGRPDPNRPPVEMRLPNNSLSVYSTLLTAMFLHGGWLHLLSNMWMLWVFGNNIEDRLGHFVYGLFYLVGGVVATVSHWAIDPGGMQPMIGASGAVAAVLGGYALSYPWVKVRTLLLIGWPFLLDLPALLVLGVWLVLETIAGVVQFRMGMMGGVAHWAHIGGFVAGLVLMPLLAIGASPEDEDWRGEVDDMFRFEDPRRQERTENQQSSAAPPDNR